MNFISCFFLMIVLQHYVLGQPSLPITNPDLYTKNTSPTAKFPVEIWVRLLNFEIRSESPLYKNATLNDPPRLFIVFKKNGKQTTECPELSGWKVNFPNHREYEFLIDGNPMDEYSLEVWDRQRIKNKLIHTFGPFKGSEWQAKFKENVSKDFDESESITLNSEDNYLSISLGYAGTRIWYRLVNITIPTDSLHTTSQLLNNPPSLYIVMHVDGEEYGSYSSVQKGWSADFPKRIENYWSVREGTKRRYKIQVWDYQRHFLNVGLNFDHLVFSIADLSGNSFRELIRETLGKNIDSKRASSILFQRIQNPQ